MYFHDYRPIQLKGVEDTRPYRSFPMIGCVAFSTDDNVIRYQLSVVNPADNFERQRARSIAEIRLAKNPIQIQTDLSPGPSGKLGHWQVLSAIMSHLSASKSTPSRVVKTARGWLGAHVPAPAPVAACCVDLSCN